MVLYYIYLYMIYLKKTEKRDFRPSRIPRAFEIWTQIFFCFLVPLPSCPNFFITLGNREHGFLDTRKWWFWPNYHINYISLSGKWNFFFWNFFLKFFFVDLFWFYGFSRNVNSRKGASSVLLFSPLGACQPPDSRP